jgi:hypothetical protein
MHLKEQASGLRVGAGHQELRYAQIGAKSGTSNRGPQSQRNGLADSHGVIKLPSDRPAYVRLGLQDAEESLVTSTVTTSMPPCGPGRSAAASSWRVEVDATSAASRPCIPAYYAHPGRLLT